MALLVAVAAVAAPLREVRGAWIVTAMGLDWPGMETDPALQQKALVEMLDRLQSANFNTVYFQVQIEGDVLWPSTFQPAAADVTGNGAMPLPYDVARFVIDESRKRGIEVYAIINPFDVGTAGAAERYRKNRVKHPFESNPDILLRKAGCYYLDPEAPETLDYLTGLYTELVSEYDFDGLLIDAPLVPFGVRDDDGIPGVATHDLAGALDDFVRALYWIVDEYRPGMKVLLASEGVAGSPVHPDYVKLLEEGYVDMIVPKLFERADYGFMPAIENWTDSPLSSRTVLAITPEHLIRSRETRSLPEITTQIEMSRDDENLAGVVIYRVSAVTDTHKPHVSEVYGRLRHDVFRYPAHLPVWDAAAERYVSRMNNAEDVMTTGPMSPENVKVEFDNDGNYVISWDAVDPDAEGVPVKYYTIYLARDGVTDLSDARGEIAHRIEGTSFVYPGLIPGLEFAVTAFDAYNRESEPSFSALALSEEMNQRPEVFRFYADNLFIAGPRQIERVEIYNLWGNRVKHVPVHHEEVSIECSDLDGGVYMTHIIYSDGSSKVEKFIK